MRAFTQRLTLAALMAAVILWGYQASAQQTDPFIGTWKVNVEKSKFSPGPPPKSGFVKYEPTADGMTKTTADLVAGDDTKQHIEYTAKDDGKEYPITGMPTVDTVTVKKIDANTVERTDKKDGKVVGTVTRRISSDGKTITVTIQGANAQGQPVNNTVVLEKY